MSTRNRLIDAGLGHLTQKEAWAELDRLGISDKPHWAPEIQAEIDRKAAERKKQDQQSEESRPPEKTQEQLDKIRKDYEAREAMDEPLPILKK